MIEKVKHSETEMGDVQPLWRYMKLSSFFLLVLKGIVFIPSLKALRALDPNEGWLPFDSSAVISTLSAHPLLVREIKWWRDKITKEDEVMWGLSGLKSIKEKDTEKVMPYIWLREMSKRRCLWCWYAAEDESMALWNIYASQGVAICSDIEGIRAILEPTHACGHYGKIIYVDRKKENPIFTEDELLLKPYLFKQNSYAHENEVRIALETPDLDRLPGVIVRVDPKKFIRRVRISPHVRRQEALVISGLLRELLGENADIAPSVELSRVSHLDQFSRTIFMDEPLKVSDFDSLVSYRDAKIFRSSCEDERALRRFKKDLETRKLHP